MRNKGKLEKKKVKKHKSACKNRGKMKENKENRGINDKKAHEKQITAFSPNFE